MTHSAAEVGVGHHPLTGVDSDQKPPLAGFFQQSGVTSGGVGAITSTGFSIPAESPALALAHTAHLPVTLTASTNSGVWTLRGIDDAVRRQFSAVSKMEDVPVGQLANQVLAEWLEARALRSSSGGS